MLSSLIKSRSRAILLAGFVCSAFTAYALDADGWDIDALDTARQAAYLTRVEKDVILELNKVRSNPAKYAEQYIKPRLAWFDGSHGGKGYKAPDQSTTVVSAEGPAAVQECIDELSARESAPLLMPREGLVRAARDHMLDTGAKGIVGHTGSDGSTIGGRMNRYGQWGGVMGENISYGADAGREIVIQLLIDDNVPNRGHRTNNMEKSFGSAGVSIGPHTRYGAMCVINFAGRYVSTNNSAEQREEQRRAEADLERRADPDAQNWNTAALDTAKNADWLSGIEKDIMLELNKLRTNPQTYARLYLNPAHRAYPVLMSAAPLPLLALERGLCLAVRDTAGGLGERIRKYGVWRGGSVSSAAVSGPYRSGREIVLDMLEAYSERTLDAGNRHIGFAVRLNEYGVRCDVIFAALYASNP
jgi:uncharacterized protein YkwD